MKNFFNTCQRRMNPWVLGVIILGIIGLLIFVPVIGVVGLIAALPLIGCVGMCGVMAFMMKNKKKRE